MPTNLTEDFTNIHWILCSQCQRLSETACADRGVRKPVCCTVLGHGEGRHGLQTAATLASHAHAQWCQRRSSLLFLEKCLLFPALILLGSPSRQREFSVAQGQQSSSFCIVLARPQNSADRSQEEAVIVRSFARVCLPTLAVGAPRGSSLLVVSLLSESPPTVRDKKIT